MNQKRNILHTPRLDRPFSNLRSVQAPQGLAARARARVARAERLDRVWGTAAWGALGVASVAGLFAAGSAAHEALATSGFYSFAALALDGAALPYLRELSLALVESLPVASLALATAFAFSSAVGIARLVARVARAPLAS